MTRIRSLPFELYLPPAILVISLLAAYLATLAPGLSWANDGSDGGDLITAAATGGVAHPTGYPLYLLLAGLFQKLPVGSLAFRTNLLSALATALAAGLVYVLTARHSAGSGQTYDWPSGLAAGYAFGLAPLVWSQAVITEVYTLQAFLTALILYLYASPSPPGDGGGRRLDRWRGLVLGLAMGNHVTTLLLLPMAFALGSVHSRAQLNGASESEHPYFPNLQLDPGALLRQLWMFLAGLSLYLIIPLRALAAPPVNWGNAVTLDRFWWLVSGQLYQSYYLQFNWTEIWMRIQTSAGLLIQQFGLPGVILGLVGLILFGTRSRLLLLTSWTVFVFAAFAVLYSSSDSYVYLMPAFLSFAVWIGLSISKLADQFRSSSFRLRIGIALLLIGYVAIQSMTRVHSLDASADLRAEAFGREVLSMAPEDAILFVKGDEAVFTLWYFHFALGERPDLAVVAEDLLHFDWYQENLRATYPALVLSDPFPWPETLIDANPWRAVCHVWYSDQAETDCSPAPGLP